MIFYSGGSSICLAGVALWYIIETSVLAPIVLTFCLTLVLWCFPGLMSIKWTPKVRLYAAHSA